MNSIHIVVCTLAVFVTSATAAQESWIRNPWVNDDLKPTSAVEATSTSQTAFSQVSHTETGQEPTSQSLNLPSAPSRLEPQSSSIHQIENPDPAVIPDFRRAASRASDLAIDKNKPIESPQITNSEIFRNCDPYPVDPRKPCNPCVRPIQTMPLTRHPLPGFLGRPYMETEPGGCRCNKQCCSCQKSEFSIYWPRPFSAKLDELFPDCSRRRYAGCQQSKLLDCFDRFEDFRLINYARRDNGCCGDFFGCGRDPYGCLGESRQIACVYGVGYRQPGEPVQRGLNANEMDRPIVARRQFNPSTSGDSRNPQFQNSLHLADHD